MASMKAKEREMKAEKEEERKVSFQMTICTACPY